MGKGGFDIQESFSGVKNSGVDWLTSGFSLPDDYPDNLLTFLHLDIAVDASTIISIIQNGTAYPLNNNQPVFGKAFRSIPIKKGDVINFQCDVNQPNLKFTLALEQ